MASKRNLRLVRKYGGRVVRVGTLDSTSPELLALYRYMAIDGEAWQPIGARVARLEHRDYKIGVVTIPTLDLIREITKDEELKRDFRSFEEYHAWYVAEGQIPRHRRAHRWPVILSDFEDETLQDGWHRFHCYVAQGAKEIPCLYYPGRPKGG